MLELYDYQVEDIEKVIDQPSILNFNSMGYGKTVEAVVLAKRKGAERILVVCPWIALNQWDRIAREWCGFEPIINPPKLTLAPRQFVIVHYEHIVSGDVVKHGTQRKFIPSGYLQQFFMFRWDMVILDEVHRIKNRATKTAMAMDMLPMTVPCAMSGSPILNKPDDLFNILHWARIPGVGNSYYDFINRYCAFEHNDFGRKPSGLTQDPKRIAELYNMMQPFLIRRSNLVWSGCRVDTVTLSMTGAQRTLYMQIVKLELEQLPETCTVMNALGRDVRLRQVTSVPEKFDLKHEDNIKLQWLISTLEDNESATMLVFSVFAEAVENICAALRKEKISCAGFHGSVTKPARMRILNEFMNGTIRVLVGTIDSLGTATDGLQTVCHTCVFFDRHWSPEINLQAIGRLDRSGQTVFVNVYYLDCAGSIDKHVGVINMNKAVDIRKVFLGE